MASGIIASVSTLNTLANKYAGQDMQTSPQNIDYFLTTVEDFEKQNQAYLDALPAN